MVNFALSLLFIIIQVVYCDLTSPKKPVEVYTPPIIKYDNTTSFVSMDEY